MSNKVISTTSSLDEESFNSQSNIKNIVIDNEELSVNSYLVRISNAQCGVVVEELF